MKWLKIMKKHFDFALENKRFVYNLCFFIYFTLADIRGSIYVNYEP